MAKLAINVNAFHFRYYMFIRKMYHWGESPLTPKMTSLCPYCQTMLWGSICLVLFSPALVLGWIFMKAGRMFCKLEGPITDRMIKFLDKRTPIIEKLDEGIDNFEKSPLMSGFVYFMMGIVILSCVVTCLASVVAIFGAIGFGLYNISDIASWAGEAFLHCVSVSWNGIVWAGAQAFYYVTWLFSQLFMGLYWAGFAFTEAYNGVIWFFTNGPLWSQILYWALISGALILGGGVASILLCIIAHPLLERFGKFVTNRFNGFSEAQERRDRAREAVKALPQWTCDFCSYENNKAEWKICANCSHDKPSPPPPYAYGLYLLYPIIFPGKWFIVNPAKWLVRKIWGVKKIIVPKINKVDILGPLGIIWSWIVALKHGVCPIVEFVDPAQVRAEAQASARELMERENEPT